MRARLRILPSLLIGLLLPALIAFGLAQPAHASHAMRRAPAIIPVTTTIQAAIEAAADGDSVLVPPGEYTESLVLTRAVNLLGAGTADTILHAVSGQRAINITGGTLTQSIVISGLTITGGDAGYGRGGGIDFESNATLLLSHLVITDNIAWLGGGLYAAGPVAMDNSMLVGNARGGAATQKAASVTDSYFERNSNGSGLLAYDSLIITNTQFISNETAGSGGGVYALGPLTISASYFANNLSGSNNGTPSYGGGALFADQSATISGTRFLSNTAFQAHGGAVYVYHGPTSIFNSRFENNRALQGAYPCCSGGGVYVYAGSLALTDTVFVSNTAHVVGGGGVYAGSVTIYGGRFEHNSAVCDSLANCDYYGSGGALYAGTAVVSGTVFVDNIADLGGGAAIANAEIINTVFSTNTSRQLGGGMVAGSTTGTSIHITDTIFVGNLVQSGYGGGVFVWGPTWLTGGVFERNSSICTLCPPGADVFSAGGGFCSGYLGYGGGPLIVSGTTFISNTAAQGGGIFADDTLSLTGAVFSGNMALVFGGGVVASNTLTVNRSIFTNNTAGDYGGALYHAGPGDGMVINSLFVGNPVTSGNGSLTFVATGTARLLHTTIAAQPAAPYAAVESLGGALAITNTIIASHSVAISQSGGAVVQDYNLFHANALTATGGVANGARSRDGDPRFADAAGGDFHLRAGSAAINSGAYAGVADDLDGRPRISGPVDIGAYEFAGFDLMLPAIRR